MTPTPRRSLALALAILSCLAPLAAGQDSEKPQVTLELSSPEYDGKARVIRLGGRSNLPEKTVLTCVVKLGENLGPRAQALVLKGGGFNFAFPPIHPKVTLIPGTYSFLVSCNPQDQTGTLREQLVALGEASKSTDTVIGDPPEAKDVKEKAHKNLLEIFGTLRELYMTTESTASFTVARIFMARKKAGGHVPPSEGERIMKDWEQYAEQHFEDNYRALNLNFKDYREGLYISPYSQVDPDIDTILTIVRKWFAVCWLEMATMLELELPKQIMDDTNFPKRDLLPQIVEATKRVYAGLGVDAQDWVQVTAFRPEEGIINGLSYLSKTSKFTISLPNEEWEFNQDMVHPQVRLRLTHKDDAKKSWGVVAVELRDYPECETPKDLDIAVEIDLSERWPGYKKLSGGSVKIDDSAMPDGKRPGFDLSFLTVAPDKKRFRMIDYALYCRWFKRTYSVIMIADEEHYEEFEKQFMAIKKSFMVLDKE